MGSEGPPPSGAQGGASPGAPATDPSRKALETRLFVGEVLLAAVAFAFGLADALHIFDGALIVAIAGLAIPVVELFRSNAVSTRLVALFVGVVAAILAVLLFFDVISRATLKFPPTSPRAGEELTVEGFGFDASESVRVDLDNGPAGPAQTSDSGSFITSVRMPDKPGEVEIRAQGADSGTEVTAIVDVEPQQPIIFWSDLGGDSEIESIGLMPGRSTTLTKNTEPDAYPAWSPDGREIAFARQGDSWDIWIMSRDGLSERRLTDDSSDDRFPVWSPDGTEILFARGLDDEAELYAVSASDASEARRLTDSSKEDRPAAWHPDRGIVFWSERNDDGDLFVIGTDGEAAPLTAANTTRIERDPAWSPDGEWLAFATDRDGQMEIYLLEVDTNEVTKLTVDAQEESGPAWSPDGTQLAFNRGRRGEAFDIWVMDLEFNAGGSPPVKSNERRLTEEGVLANHLDPSWD